MWHVEYSEEFTSPESLVQYRYTQNQWNTCETLKFIHSVPAPSLPKQNRGKLYGKTWASASKTGMSRIQTWLVQSCPPSQWYSKHNNCQMASLEIIDRCSYWNNLIKAIWMAYRCGKWSRLGALRLPDYPRRWRSLLWAGTTWVRWWGETSLTYY